MACAPLPHPFDVPADMLHLPGLKQIGNNSESDLAQLLRWIGMH